MENKLHHKLDLLEINGEFRRQIRTLINLVHVFGTCINLFTSNHVTCISQYNNLVTYHVKTCANDIITTSMT